MVSAWTLPLIRMELEMLPRNCDFLLDAADAARLFGGDEHAEARIAFFAAGHGCTATAGKDRVAFRKRADQQVSVADADVGPAECFPACGPAPRINCDDHPGPDCR
jgi:hypothetical protein